jgi:hypothetical protein
MSGTGHNVWSSDAHQYSSYNYKCQDHIKQLISVKTISSNFVVNLAVQHSAVRNPGSAVLTIRKGPRQPRVPL